MSLLIKAYLFIHLCTVAAAKDMLPELHLLHGKTSQLLLSGKFTNQAERKQTANEGIRNVDEFRPES